MSKRSFEDIDEGEIYDVGSFEVDAAEIQAFADRYDPQPIHTDAEVAADSIFDGLIASGWFTAASCMRLLVDGFFNETISMGAFGMEELWWPTPVRPGDTVSVSLEIADKRQSTSRSDRGYVEAAVT